MVTCLKLKNIVLAGCIIALASLPGLAGTSEASAKVLAKVDGMEVTSEEFELAMQDIGRTLPRRMRGQQRTAYILNYLIDMKLAARKAEKEQLQKASQFERQMAYFRQKALMQTYLDKISTSAADASKIQSAYDDAAKEHKGETEVNASHILVKTKAEAEAALKRVQGGEDFAKVAKEVSKDPGSPGGNLGWFTKKRMVPPFAEMAFKTEPGKISPPVKSRFGWHIIKVKDRRTKTFPKIEQVRGQIKQFLTRKAQTSAIRTLRSSAKVEKIPAPK